MSKIVVPPAPVASFEESAVAARDMHARRGAAVSKALDAVFLRQVKVSLCRWGLGLTVCIGALSGSPLVAWSFAVGVGVGLLLLISQQWFVQTILALRARVVSGQGQTPAWLRAPLTLALPAKWIVIAVLMTTLLRNGLLVPWAFGVGCTLLQVVIVVRGLSQLTRKPLEHHIEASHKGA